MRSKKAADAVPKHSTTRNNFQGAAKIPYQPKPSNHKTCGSRYGSKSETSNVKGPPHGSRNQEEPQSSASLPIQRNPLHASGHVRSSHSPVSVRNELPQSHVMHDARQHLGQGRSQANPTPSRTSSRGTSYRGTSSNFRGSANSKPPGATPNRGRNAPPSGWSRNATSRGNCGRERRTNNVDRFDFD